MALRNDFEMFRGVDKRIRVTLDPVPSGGISGWTFTMTWRLTPGTDDPPILEKGISDPWVIEDADLAIFYIDVEDGDTTALTTQDYSFDIKRMNSGFEAVLVWGTVSLLAEVTR